MTPLEAFTDGQLFLALHLQQALVHDQPEDAAARLFLVELLTFAGRLTEARDHLRAVPSHDPGWPAWRTYLLQLLQADWRRTVRGRRPVVVPEPVPAHAKWRWRAIRAMRAGDVKRAVLAVDRAEARSPEVSGFVDGREFLGLRDADDRFASVLEAFVDGSYLWFPWEKLRRIRLIPASQPRDHWVRPAELRLRDGSEVGVHLPLLYPGSAEAEGAFAVGQETDHVCPDGGPVRCIGAKLLLCGEEEVRLGDARMIEIGEC